MKAQPRKSNNLQCMSINVPGLLESLTGKAGWEWHPLSEDLTGCPTFHYTLRELDAYVSLNQGIMSVLVNGKVIYDDHYQLDPKMEPFVYVSGSEDVEELQEAA